MFSLFEVQGQSSLPHKSGTVEINTEYHTEKKPVWLVLLKLLGVAAMVAVGAAIAMPTLLELNFPLIQAVAITLGGMMVYTGIAFFFRPEPNTDNLSDKVNRFLWKAHCVLGPGRFTAETFLDTCALLGIVKGNEVASHGGPEQGLGGAGPLVAGSFDATQPIAPLDPNRFAQSSGNFVAGQIQLDSQRFFGTSPGRSESAAGKV
ncbi:MAG TPA: hypothetical protein VKH44_03985 [Pirellulaceae bacterium]|nr:hypothetical protein [Pirellulaceae bacterium]